MNTFTYDEITVGQKIRFHAAVTPEQMEQFRELTGDHNPLHTDAEFARRKGHPDRVVYGMLTASFLSTVAGMYLPGERSLIHEVQLKFVKPLLLSSSNDLRIIAEVIEKHDLFRRLTLKVSVEDAQGVKVLRAVMKVGVSE
ncbi:MULTISPECIES: MaoC/PaaZ C-terminal domain-containing protein [unclassified Anaerotruncus]|uniref:MaoC/PaaZ C-terminal domain-containing protein n=1 Tax=Anaerotruncus sp. 1XD42-93 TaxID=2320853 RepID=UPI000EA265AF|nr:dehydratase [Anaerotruncus sp. 1XD42-93]NCE75942.1 dehydratase [Anaerotruncus sp. X29]RKJ80777.1 dehydratase [Anaerotruncus sp. 1XD22-93]